MEETPDEGICPLDSNSDLTPQPGNYERTLNEIIEKADVEELAKRIGIEYPLNETKIQSFDKYILLDAGDVNGLTPLMTAALHGKRKCLSLLLSCGADVNASTQFGKLAVDFSLDQSDPEITLLLFRNDSVFPDLSTGDKREKFNLFMVRCAEIQKLFNDRNEIHEALKARNFDRELQNTIEKSCSQYFVNGKGSSLLYTAGNNKNFEAWAFLVSKGMQYANWDEEEDMKKEVSSYKDEIHRALERHFHTVKGCHVMKMVAKSIVFGDKEKLEDVGKKIEGFFRHLDEDELTSVLLKVLQDVEGFKIAFDFDSENLRRMLPCSGDIIGLTDPRRNRIYVRALETKSCRRSDLLGNLAHELAHKACFVVFQNGGLPYKNGDNSHREEYRKILGTLKSSNILKKSQEIIMRVFNNYVKWQWEHELIVRVPEIIASFRCEAVGHDGMGILREETSELLAYYENYVMPEFFKYVRKIYTSNRITGRTLIDYQELLSVNQEKGVKISQKTKNVEFSKHNDLKTFLVSSLKLGRSHLRVWYQNQGKSILFVDWSQFIECETLLIDGLEKDEIGLLAVMWDLMDEPKFCKTKTCWSEQCPAYHFGTMTEHVVMLLDKELPLLDNSKRVDYSWNELSVETKYLILEKDVNFGGSQMSFKNIILSVTEGENLDRFMSDSLDPKDISYLLEVPSIDFGKPIGWTIGFQACNIFKSHPDCFVPRSLCQKYVALTTTLLDRKWDSIFFVSNADISSLQRLGIKTEYLNTWNPVDIHSNTRCYAYDAKLDPKEETLVFEEIVQTYSTIDKIKKIHYLKLNSGHFLFIKSIDSQCVGNKEDLKEDANGHFGEGDFTFTKEVTNLLDDSNFLDDDSTAVVIADDPGCGKSVFLNRMAIDLKKTMPKVWVVLLDLKCWAKPDSIQRFENGHDALDLLFSMVKGSETTFEKIMFKIFARRKNQLVVMFDGFDEICPDFREPVTSFLVALKTKTQAKICVTTRLHEKHDLVQSLNGVSFNLVPLRTEEQVMFLNKYWNRLFKSLPPEHRLNEMKSLMSGMQNWIAADDSDVDLTKVTAALAENISKLEKDIACDFTEVDFKMLLEKLLSKCNLICDGVEQFTQTPLHVQIIGFIVFKDFMTIGKRWNLGYLYQRIFDMKIEVFHSEKASSNGNLSAKKSARMAKITASITLQKLSSNIFHGSKVYELEPRDIEDALAVGLLTERFGDHHFVHLTFCEFFFAKWLLRKAKNQDIVSLWVHKIFFEEKFTVVRLFLEDLLSLRSSGVEGFSGDKVTYLRSEGNLEEVSPKEKEEIQKCLYALILDCYPEILQFFADSLGKPFVTLFFEDIDINTWDLKQGMPLTKALQNYKSYYSGTQNLNAFTFASYCLQKVTNVPPEKYIAIVQKMFYLVGEFNLAQLMNNMLMERGMRFILPFVHEQKPCMKYLEAIVYFFIGKHKETFRETLKLEFLESYQIWFSVIGKGVKMFNLMTKLADAILDSSGFESMLLKSSDFFELWIGTVRYRDFEKVRHVWDYVDKKLRKEKRVEFLKRKGYKNYNVLTQAVLNKDPRVAEFIWDLAISLIHHEESKLWLLDSFSRGRPSRLDCKNTPSGIYYFFNKLLSRGTAYGELISSILLSKDDGSNHFLLTFKCFYDMVESLLSFYDLMSHKFLKNTVEIVRNIDFSFAELVKWLFERKYAHIAEESKNKIESEFRLIISSETFAKLYVLHYGEKCIMDQDSWKVMTSVSFKSFVVAFHKYVKLYYEIYNQKHLMSHLTYPSYSNNIPYPSIMYHLLEIEFPFTIAYIGGILLQFLPNEEMEDLLLAMDKNGDTVFHISAREKELMNWMGFYDVARVLWKEEAIIRVHVSVNRAGRSVLDILLDNQPTFSKKRRISSMSENGDNVN